MKIVQPTYKILRIDDNMESHIELCARNCYKSEGSITKDSASKMVRKLIELGHEAMLEHASVTIQFTADIGFYKDLTRHRAGISFAIESTRWCSYDKDKFDNELSFVKPVDITYGSELYYAWFKACENAEKDYMRLKRLNATNDQARSVLPHSLKADTIITANIREWRHIFKLRTQPQVNPNIRYLLKKLLSYLVLNYSSLFGDLKGCCEEEYREIIIEVDNFIKKHNLEDTPFIRQWLYRYPYAMKELEDSLSRLACLNEDNKSYVLGYPTDMEDKFLISIEEDDLVLSNKFTDYVCEHNCIPQKVIVG